MEDQGKSYSNFQIASIFAFVNTILDWLEISSSAWLSQFVVSKCDSKNYPVYNMWFYILL